MSFSRHDNEAFVAHLLPQYPLNEAVSYIQHCFSPEDIFDADVLEKWAEENGFVKASEGAI